MTATVTAKPRKNGRAPAKVQTATVAPFAALSFAKRGPDEDGDRIPLFEIDGTEYTIPAVVPTGDALLHLAVTNNLPDEAMRGMYLLRELAGPDALTALLGQADMSDTDWHKLISILSTHCFGRLEAPGN